MDQSIVPAPATSNQRRPPPRRPLCGTRLDPTLLELVEILNSNNADKLLQEDDIYERFPFEIIDADTPKLEEKEEYLLKSPRHFSKDNMVRRTLANGLAFWKMNDKLGCIANEAAVPLGEVRHFTLFYGDRPGDKSEGIKSDWRMVEITSVGGDGKSSIAILKDCNSKVKECCLELQKAKKKLLAEATSLALAMLTKNKAVNKNKPKAKKKNKAKDDQAGADDEFKESREVVADLTKKVRAAEKKLQEAKNDARERDWSNVEIVKTKKKTNKGGEEQSVDMDGSLGRDEEADIGHYMREYTSNVVLTDKVETEQGNMISDPILIEATRLFGDVDNELHSSQSTTNNDAKSRVTIVIIGHADSGKSTLAGHLLYKVGAVGKSVIESYEKDAALMNKGSLKYAWVMDKSIAERERGITIDIGEGNFETQHYNFTVLDAPGQHDYIETMIRGTFQADTAVLVLDSTTGSFESGLCVVGQTREHALLAYTLGVKRMICCCNKMDVTTPKYSKWRYYEMVKKMSDCLIKTGYKLEELVFIPVSGFDGDNLIEKSTNLDWYKGPTLLEALQQINSPVELVRKPLRVPLLNIHEIEGIGTMALGSVEAGVIQEGMLLRFAPTGSTAKVNSLVMKGKKVFQAIPGDMVAFSCSQVSVNDLARGYVASDAEEDPARRAISFTSQVLVLNHPGKIKNGYTALVECHASKVSVMFEKLLGKKDRGSGSYLEKEPQYLMNGDVGLVRMVPAQPMVVETFTEFPTLGHFVVWDMGQIVAVGVVKSVDKECPD